MQGEQTQRLRHEKETKNTHRYDAVQEGQPPILENVYLKKWAVGEEAPEEIRVTVEPADD